MLIAEPNSTTTHGFVPFAGNQWPPLPNPSNLSRRLLRSLSTNHNLRLRCSPQFNHNLRFSHSPSINPSPRFSLSPRLRFNLRLPR